MNGPLLVTVAHGTRTAAGNDVARAVTAAAAEHLDLPAVASYVELCEPSFAEVVRAAVCPVIAVPLLLSTGFHVRKDLPAAIAPAAVPVALAPPLGPHPLLGAALSLRLREAGAEPGTPAVLVAAGSQDRAALTDLRSAARVLAGTWGAPVRMATLGGLGPRPEEVVRAGDVVAPYLLAEGFFTRRCRELSLAAGASVVAPPIAVCPPLVDLVVARAEAALAAHTAPRQCCVRSDFVAGRRTRWR